jgi:hypothetical protein
VAAIAHCSVVGRSVQRAAVVEGGVCPALGTTECHVFRFNMRGKRCPAGIGCQRSWALATTCPRRLPCGIQVRCRWRASSSCWCHTNHDSAALHCVCSEQSPCVSHEHVPVSRRAACACVASCRKDRRGHALFTDFKLQLDPPDGNLALGKPHSLAVVTLAHTKVLSAR